MMEVAYHTRRARRYIVAVRVRELRTGVGASGECPATPAPALDARRVLSVIVQGNVATAAHVGAAVTRFMVSSQRGAALRL